MGQTIPGLVMMAQSLPSQVTGQEVLDRPVVGKLWQAFHASRRASHNEVDHRLEYLFWRLWGSHELLHHIGLSALDDLVSTIATSTSSQARVSSSPPGASLTLTPSQPQKIPTLPRSIAPPTGHSHSKSHPTEGQKSIHPILKKPATAPSETQKSTRLLLERPDGGNITCNPSIPPTPRPASPSNYPKDVPAARPATRKPPPTAMRPVRGSRRRPVFNRRKSSQTSTIKSSASRSMESKGFKKSDRRSSVTDEEDSESSTQDNEVDSGHDEPEADQVPFPIEISPVTPSDPSDTITLTDQASVTDLPPSISRTTVTPTVVPISEKQESILSEIETVSQDPLPQGQAQQRAESPNTSSESEDRDLMTQATDVPGLPGAKRIPMPKKMTKQLLRILRKASHTNEKIPLPNGPCVSAERVWLPVYPRAYLEDWMLQDESSSSAPQPSNRPLVTPGFRRRFEVEVEGWRKEEEALKGVQGHPTSMD
ncbi:hypothetical protein N7492_000383 [Penicillium capsulatum]|uniref:Nitrogen regulatory protein areA GATA-like domain-containing protein n=1 Tax=Penicillium capsulatum TaxID=69766 RepID=A0A9W9LZZ6_9EURO|nr:hypothetical protein N7492_000383 [Penicillium capsulatum]KAJ6130553.1 hypothetical protein N7512_003333 [Penicillium capsulatum]